MAERETDFREIERKWRRRWEETGAHKVRDDDPRQKYYCLDMFPYPSGVGLHVGHWRGYVLSDVWTRYKTLQGYNVLHPMGWDSFGLPAENDAIKKGIHPAKNTADNIANFRRQLDEIGAMYDWDREVNTCNPRFYKWTQWIFLHMFKRGLAYKAMMPINWCPSCKCGLANEEVVAGLCERCGSEATKKEMSQWMLRITSYAQRLLDDLDKLNWSDRVKTMQANWIGRSEGAMATFRAVPPGGGDPKPFDVFTTRPDTLFGATYVVFAPEHPMVREMCAPEKQGEVDAYIERSKKISEIERANIKKEKTGVFIGAYAVNPVNGKEVPIWIADYVMLGYGTGMIMAVPAHDERDFEFATTFDLPIIEVVHSDDAVRNDDGTLAEAYVGEGTMMNSGEFDGLRSEVAKEKITDWLNEKGLAEHTVTYRLRDWVFSRQRYWGEPIPIVNCDKCGHVPVDESDLPILLPDVERYEPTGTGESPLASMTDWVNTTCPQCGGDAKRETDTMPQWAGSSWYALRYASPDCDTAVASPDALRDWLPVDLYVGGIEHAILHLLYARFFTKFLYDIGAIEFDEPFTRLFNQGMICRKSEKTGKVEKMSKSKGNVVAPDDLVAEYGTDSVRLYELFVGPPEVDSEWNDRGIEGMYRFQRRLWNWVESTKDSLAEKTGHDLEMQRHILVKKVTERLESFRFNTAISAMMEFLNYAISAENPDVADMQTVETALIVLSPFAPHLAEELWERTGHKDSIFKSSWPAYDESLTELPKVTVAVQVNGKVRGTLEIDADSAQEVVEEAALQAGTVANFVAGKKIVKRIYVPNKIVNFVVR